MDGCWAGGVGTDWGWGGKLEEPGKETSSSRNKKARGWGQCVRYQRVSQKVPVAGLRSFKSNTESLGSLPLLAYRC